MESKNNSQLYDSGVTDDERWKALKYCKDHLFGAWKYVDSLGDLEISRLSGGMSNLLYRCNLADNIKTQSDEPRVVLLRLYGRAQGDINGQLNIFNQLAKEKLGPALYSAFDEGRFEEFLPSYPTSWSDITDDLISAVVAKKIASIHKLNVKCLNRESNWLIDNFNEIYGFILKARTRPLTFRKDTLDSTKAIAHELMANNFQQEIDFMKRLFQRSTAQLVFSHNDLHQNNILLLDDDVNHQNLKDRIVLIDFEFSSYNYRPFDMANHLSEWCFDYTGDSYPNFSASIDRFPSLERQRRFLRSYVEELSDTELSGESGESNNHSLNGDRKLSENEKIDSLLEEMQPFMMASNLLWTLWAMRSACISDIKFGYWVSRNR